MILFDCHKFRKAISRIKIFPYFVRFGLVHFLLFNDIFRSELLTIRKEI